MDQLMKMASDAGMTKEQGESATGGIFSLVKKYVDSGDYQKILGTVPEMDSLVTKYEDSAAKDEGGSGGGGLMGSLTSALGGSAGGLAELLGGLNKQGVDMKQMNSFMPQVADFTKKQCGVDISSFLGVSSTEGEAGGAESVTDSAQEAMGSVMGMFGK